MTTITTYSVTHNLPRTSGSAPDADAIMARVNAVTASNGDSITAELVQRELDTMATAEVQALYGLRVIGTDIELDE